MASDELSRYNTSGQADSDARSAERPAEVLTQRELQVLKLMADGLSTKVIAQKLGISFKTAACHRYRILSKIGVDTTVSAMRWAIRNGLIEP